MQDKYVNSMLIYIPTYVDYKMALANAQEISKQTQMLPVELSFLNIKVIISVNDSIRNPLTSEKYEIIKLSKNVGADVNISLGFIKALELDPTYLWILSANETLAPNAISEIANQIKLRSSVDIFVANAAGRSGNIKIKNILRHKIQKSSLGLISGVIYRTDRTKEFFYLGPILNFTGWGHLAVIQGCIHGISDLRIYEFPDNKIYEKPKIFNPEGISNMRNFIRSTYRHSFYGEVIIAPFVFPNTIVQVRKFLWGWFIQNWYRLGFFFEKRTDTNEAKDAKNIWMHNLFVSTIKRYSLTLFLTVKVLEKIDFYKFRKLLRKFTDTNI